jgi:hypothetical protein
VVAAISPQDAWQQLLPDINNRPRRLRSSNNVVATGAPRPRWTPKCNTGRCGALCGLRPLSCKWRASDLRDACVPRCFSPWHLRESAGIAISHAQQRPSAPSLSSSTVVRP